MGENQYLNEKVYLTFKTDRGTSEMLKLIAHKMGKSQPELIDEICHDFIKQILSFVEEETTKKANNDNIE